MSKRAWIYVRVSSEEQSKGYSLESQEAHCRAYASQHGYTVIDVAQDIESGEHLERRGMIQVIEAAAFDPFDLLIVYDLDRFSRGGPAHCAILETQLERHGVALEFVLGNFNGDSPEATLSRYIKQSISWYENQQRRERVIRGRLTAAKRGVVLTGARPPYGYTNDNGKLSVIPEEAAIVRRIFTELLEGSSAHKIAENLSSDGVLTAADKKAHLAKRNAVGIWHVSTVLKIIKNPVYIGVWQYNKRRSQRDGARRFDRPRPPEEWIDVAVPALIDNETFEQAKLQIAKNRAQAKRNTKANYLLQHLVICTCGRRCACETDSRSGLRRYLCPNRRRRAWEVNCPTRFSLKAEILESAVWSLVVDMLLDPAYLQAWFNTQRAQASDVRCEIEQRLSGIAASLKEVEDKLGTLLDLALVHDFPRTVVEERRRLLAAQQQRLEVEQRQSQAALATVSFSEEHEQGLLVMVERLSSGIDRLDFAAQRKVLELLQIQISVITQNTVKVQALLPLGGQSGSVVTDSQGASVGYAIEVDLASGILHPLNDLNV